VSNPPNEEAVSDPLTSLSPPVSAGDAERIVAEHYGIVAEADRLAGERDENFRLTTADGGSYFLKIAHAGERPEVTNLSTCALLHLAEVAPDFPVQAVIRTLRGDPELNVVLGDGHPRTARVTSYMEGRMLHSVPSSPQLRRNLGATLARLGQALRSFSHPGAFRELLWDIQHAHELWKLLDEIDALADRDLIAQCLQRFDSVVRPQLPHLRAQVLHNDLSVDNVLVDASAREVVGIIDFGDMAYTPLVNDVAIAAAYQLSDGPDPFAPVIDLVVGYHEVEPLTVQELTLMYDLVRTRVTARIVITEWRATRFPENRAYISRYTDRAWFELGRLDPSSGDEVTEKLFSACAAR
jgi:Ser/Thr protein kinase RdoA (MazF antagonist)